MIEAVRFFRKRYIVGPDRRHGVLGDVRDLEDLRLALKMRPRRQIRVDLRFAQIHDQGQFADCFLQKFQRHLSEVLIQRFRQQFVERDHCFAFKKLFRNFFEHPHAFGQRKSRCEKRAELPRVVRQRPTDRLFLGRQQITLKIFHFGIGPRQHFPVARGKRDALDFLRRRTAADFCRKCLDLAVDLRPSARTARQNFRIDALDLEADQLVVLAELRFDLVPEEQTRPGKRVEVDFVGIADRLEHLLILQRLVLAGTVARHVHDHVVRVQLRIEQTA